MYRVTKEILSNEENITYISYGIETASGHKVSDVSVNKQKIENFVKKLNLNKTPEYYLLHEIDMFLTE